MSKEHGDVMVRLQYLLRYSDSNDVKHGHGQFHLSRVYSEGDSVCTGHIHNAIYHITQMVHDFSIDLCLGQRFLVNVPPVSGA